jgi:hypothetical protein
MGHCCGFDYVSVGLRRISLSVKICDNFPAVGHSAGFGNPLWAVAKDLVNHYWPWRSIWLCAMTIAQNQLALHRTTQQFLKACRIL